MKEKENSYENIKVLYHSAYSVYFSEDKDILLSAGYDGIILWDVKNNYEQIIYFSETSIFWKNQLERIDDDKIIVVTGDCDLKMISVSEKK